MSNVLNKNIVDIDVNTIKDDNPDNPPNGRSSAEHEHKWVYQGTDYKYKYSPYGNSEYEKIDTYYCEKCLKCKENIRYECSREAPYWFKG